MNDASEACIEQQLKQQGADAPRLSPEHIEQTIGVFMGLFFARRNLELNQALNKLRLEQALK